MELATPKIRALKSQGRKGRLKAIRLIERKYSRRAHAHAAGSEWRYVQHYVTRHVSGVRLRVESWGQVQSPYNGYFISGVGWWDDPPDVAGGAVVVSTNGTRCSSELYLGYAVVAQNGGPGCPARSSAWYAAGAVTAVTHTRIQLGTTDTFCTFESGTCQYKASYNGFPYYQYTVGPDRKVVRTDIWTRG
jgi:hypothetical protein